jgi:hypothetical protein
MQGTKRDRETFDQFLTDQVSDCCRAEVERHTEDLHFQHMQEVDWHVCTACGEDCSPVEDSE